MYTFQEITEKSGKVLLTTSFVVFYINEESKSDGN